MLRELHLSLLFIILIIAHQMSAYLFYKYYQIRKENLGLNKFLIAFGLLYGVGFSGIVLRSINSYYIENLLLKNILNDISHIIISFGLFSFLIVVSQKEFREVVNRRITKIIALLTLIFSTFMLFPVDILLILILILFSILIGATYMILFHLKLIQKSTGRVKNRIVLLFIGEIIIIVAVIFGTEKNPYIYNLQVQEFIKLFFSLFIIIGQMIVFYAFYDFPVFLEFNWENKLVKLYIIDKNRRRILYNYNFVTNTNEINENPPSNDVFFSSGIIGIEDIISTLSQKSKEKIQKINLEEQILLFDHGTNGLDALLFCILVRSEAVSINFFLKMIKSRFQEYYKNVLYDLDAVEGKESKIFNSFNKQIKILLSRR
ncbi:MAG: hypothetical protein ACFE9Z_02540 [Promethearchaeota archaeon]